MFPSWLQDHSIYICISVQLPVYDILADVSQRWPSLKEGTSAFPLTRHSTALPSSSSILYHTPSFSKLSATACFCILSVYDPFNCFCILHLRAVILTVNEFLNTTSYSPS